MQSQTIFRHKLILILTGVCLFFVLLEIGLRLGGFMILAAREFQNASSIRDKGSYRIMCIGGSTTACGGSDSYPSQLERILNEKNIGIKFRVINRGIESVDSSYLLKHLPENLDTYSPDMVTVMIGENDCYATIPYDTSFSKEIGFFFRNIKIFKVCNNLRSRFKAKRYEEEIRRMHKENAGVGRQEAGAVAREIEEGASFSDAEVKVLLGVKALFDDSVRYKNEANFRNPNENYRKAREALEKAIALNPHNVALRIQMADCYMLENKTKKAAEILTEVIKEDPQNLHALQILGWCYQVRGESEKEEAALKRATEIAPGDRIANACLASFYINKKAKEEMNGYIKELKQQINKIDFTYGLLGTLCGESGDHQEAERHYQKGDEFRLRYYNRATRYNYQKIKEMALGRNIKLVCIQHPMRSVAALQLLVGPAEGVVFVDNEKVFKGAVRQKGYRYYFTDCFAGDFGHCTVQGNRLLAENIADRILEEAFPHSKNKEENTDAR